MSHWIVITLSLMKHNFSRTVYYWTHDGNIDSKLFCISKYFKNLSKPCSEILYTHSSQLFTVFKCHSND